jgi:CheY-like chemotaxis protein
MLSCSSSAPDARYRGRSPRYDGKATIARAMKSGAVAFLRKPFNVQDFLNAIQEALTRL